MKKKLTPGPSKLDSAWSEFYNSQKLDDPKKLHAEGWRTPHEIAEEIHTTLQACRSMCARNVSSGKFEQKKARALTSWGVRDTWHYRPKL